MAMRRCIAKIHENRKSRRGISSNFSFGFTLLEILIAVTILAFIIGTLYATFIGSMSTIDRVEKTSEVYQLGRLILQQFVMDLESVYFDESQAKASDSEEEQQVFTGKDVTGDASEQRLDQLSFLTTSSRITESDSAAPQLWRVSYILVPDEESGNYQLIRRAVPSLYGEAPAGQGEEDTGKEYDFLLSSRVRSLKFEYIDLEGDEKESWNPQDNPSEPLVPPEVKISVTLDNPEGEPISFNTRIFLPLTVKRGEF